MSKQISTKSKRSVPRVIGKVSKSTSAKLQTKPKRKSVLLSDMEDAVFYHELKRGTHWKVRKEGADRASGLFSTKVEAVTAARELKVVNKHIFVHKADGSIGSWIKSPFEFA